MTTKPTIDGVSRESAIQRLTEIANRDSAVAVTVRAEDLRALLDAPAVEHGWHEDECGNLKFWPEQLDAAQATIAQLEAENEKFDAGMRNLACQLSAGGYNAETLTAEQLIEKVQWGINNLAEVSEQRIAELERGWGEPVSVVLPIKSAFYLEVFKLYGFGPDKLCMLTGKDLEKIWDACLDATAALNAKRPEHHDAPSDYGTHPDNDGLEDYRK